LPTTDNYVLIEYFDVPIGYLTGSGLFADFDWIIKTRDDLTDKFSNEFGVRIPYVDGVTKVDPITGEEAFRKMSDIDYVAFLSAFIESIDFIFDENEEPEEIRINFK